MRRNPFENSPRMYCASLFVHFYNPSYFTLFHSFCSFDSLGPIPIVRNRNTIIFQFARGIIASLISRLLKVNYFSNFDARRKSDRRRVVPRNSHGCKLDSLSPLLVLYLSRYGDRKASGGYANWIAVFAACCSINCSKAMPAFGRERVANSNLGRNVRARDEKPKGNL